jgi:hypothetical protein
MLGESLMCLLFQRCATQCMRVPTGDPVNLATGDEDYTPPSDISIYNPTGPSFTFSRSYHSLSNPLPAGMGLGWSHNYNWRIAFKQSAGIAHLTQENGAQINLTPRNYQQVRRLSRSP